MVLNPEYANRAGLPIRQERQLPRAYEVWGPTKTKEEKILNFQLNPKRMKMKYETQTLNELTIGVAKQDV